MIPVSGFRSTSVRSKTCRRSSGSWSSRAIGLASSPPGGVTLGGRRPAGPPAGRCAGCAPLRSPERRPIFPKASSAPAVVVRETTLRACRHRPPPGLPCRWRGDRRAVQNRLSEEPAGSVGHIGLAPFSRLVTASPSYPRRSRHADRRPPARKRTLAGGRSSSGPTRCRSVARRGTRTSCPRRPESSSVTRPAEHAEHFWLEATDT